MAVVGGPVGLFQANAELKARWWRRMRALVSSRTRLLAHLPVLCAAAVPTPCGRGLDLPPSPSHSAHAIAPAQDLTLAQKMQRWTNIKLTARIMAAPIATFAVCGAAYKATDCLVRQYLGREDVLSGIAGGIAVGTVLGLRSNSAPTAIKLSALFAGACAMGAGI